MQGANDEPSIRRSDLEAALASDFIFQTDDGRFLTFDEAFDELLPTMMEGLAGAAPEDQVVDGSEFLQFIVESGIFRQLEVDGRVVTQYSDGRKRWTGDQLRDQVFPLSKHEGLSFENWRSAQIDAGALTTVEVLQFLGYADENANEQSVIIERLVSD